MQNLRGFLEGGLASIVAGCSTHPFDVIKVRMQLEASDSSSSSLSFNVSDLSSSSSSCASSPAMCVGTDPFSVGLRLVQAEGLHSLFTGISATILRQSLYSTTRMGLYELLKYQWRDPARKGGMSVFKKVAAGLIAGGVGAIVGNPADLAMVRMQVQNLYPFLLF